MCVFTENKQNLRCTYDVTRISFQAVKTASSYFISEPKATISTKVCAFVIQWNSHRKFANSPDLQQRLQQETNDKCLSWAWKQPSAHLRDISFSNATPQVWPPFTWQRVGISCLNLNQCVLCDLGMSVLSASRWQFSASKYIFNQKSSVTCVTAWHHEQMCFSYFIQEVNLIDSCCVW